MAYIERKDISRCLKLPFISTKFIKILNQSDSCVLFVLKPLYSQVLHLVKIKEELFFMTLYKVNYLCAFLTS